MSVIKAILAGLAISFSSGCFGADILDPDRTVVIDDVIDGDNLKPLAEAMLTWSAESKDPIDIVINSPGGQVFSGYDFISVMEEVRGRDVTIRCYVGQVAASMAFQILLHCNERTALTTSNLLFHRVRIGVQGIVTGPTADALAKQLLDTDMDIQLELMTYLDMDPRTLSYHFEHETLHRANNLAKIANSFMEVHNRVPGLMTILHGKTKDDKVLRASDFRRGSIFDLFKRGGLLYIAPSYVTRVMNQGG